MLKNFFNKYEEHKLPNQSIEDQDKEERSNIMLKPKICIFDFNEEVYSSLKRKGFNVTEATLGTPVKVPNNSSYDKKLCLSNYDFPKNIHEFDIILIDLSSKDKETISYDKKDHFRGEEKNDFSYAFISEYPQTVFDSRAFAANLLSKQINDDSIVIVFASHKETYKYFLAKITSDGCMIEDTFEYSNYSVLKNIPHDKNLYGEEMKVIIQREDLKKLLQKYLDEFFYEAIFHHPTTYKNGRFEKPEDFLPLIQNNNDQIISYIDLRNNPIFMLPQIDNKIKIIEPLLEEILPDIYPKVFPYSTTFSWKEKEEYWLPNHRELVQKKEEIQIEYENKIDTINKKIKDNYDKFSFLHKIITGTGDELVKVVKKYLDWLGFEKVKEMDDYNTDVKEEDLQVELEEGLLVIEVKGIGGTSKDSDCNQINKIKFRRAEERVKFDVYGLYIVNHQRYLPPKERENPPFTKEQISDAEIQKRGLLTTWELLKAYYLIEEAIINKRDVREKILEFGLVNLSPDDLKYIYKAKEVFKDGKVFIVELDNLEIKLNEELIVLKNGNYKKVKILNLQKNDIDIEKESNGEIGIKVDKKIKKNSKIFIKEQKLTSYNSTLATSQL